MKYAAAPLLAVALLAAAPSTEVEGRYFTLATSAIRYNVGTGAFASDAAVRITKTGLEASADRAEGNTVTGQATLRGNVRVRDAGGPGSVQGKNAKPALLTCDQLEVDGRADTYKAAGHAHYESADRTASADTMLLDRKAKKLHLEGGVTITQGDSTAQAAAVDVDLKTGRSVSTGSPVILSRPASGRPEAAPVSPIPRPAPSPSPQ